MEERTCDGGDVRGSVNNHHSGGLRGYFYGSNLGPPLGVLRICDHTVQASSRGHATVGTAMNVNPGPAQAVGPERCGLCSQGEGLGKVNIFLPLSVLPLTHLH